MAPRQNRNDKELIARARKARKPGSSEKPHITDSTRSSRKEYSSIRKPKTGNQARNRGFSIALSVFILGAIVYLFIRTTDRLPSDAPSPIEQALRVNEIGEIDQDLASAVTETPPAIAIPPQDIGPSSPFQSQTIEIRRGDTLFGALRDTGIDRRNANRVVNAIQEVFDVRKIRPGQSVEIETLGPTNVVSGVFHANRLLKVFLRLDSEEKVVAEKQVIKPVTKVDSATILVSGSLAQNFAEEGLPYSLLIKIANLFAWSIDFSNSVWAGDELSVVFERLFVDGEEYGIGRVLAAEFKGQAVSSSLYHFPINEQDEWFHADGRNVKAAFLRAPLNFTRISSKFTRKRFHPVLKRYRPHSGVDFAAPSGTPVVSVADGTVIGAGTMGGAGKAVRIKHINGWITSYSHLSRILVRKGQRVRQNQKIGLVGSTGYSTGPHLDFRIKVNGKFVDPLRIDLPKGERVPKKMRAEFDRMVNEHKKWLATASPKQSSHDLSTIGEASNAHNTQQE